jgi:hypothetical protein
MKLWRWLLASYIGVFLIVGPFPFQIVGAKSPVCTEQETHSFMQDLACTILTSKSKNIKWPINATITTVVQVFKREKDGLYPYYPQEVIFDAYIKDGDGRFVTRYDKYYRDQRKYCDKDGIAQMVYTVNFYEGYSMNITITPTGTGNYSATQYAKKLVLTADEVKFLVSDGKSYSFRYPPTGVDIIVDK